MEQVVIVRMITYERSTARGAVKSMLGWTSIKQRSRSR
jgi:hypothetical protein